MAPLNLIDYNTIIRKRGKKTKKSPASRPGNAHQALSEAWVGGENAPDIYIIVTTHKIL